MKIEPVKLRRLLERTSIWDTKAAIEHPQLNFGEEGVEQRELDLPKIIGSCLKVGKGYFKEYEAIGKKSFPATSLIKVLTHAFKGDEAIDLVIGEKVSLIGRKERYSEAIPATMLGEELEMKELTNSILPAKFDIKRSYKLSIAELSEVPMNETCKLIYGDGVKVVVETSTSKFEKDLTVKEKTGEGSGEVEVDAKLLGSILTQFEGDTWINFSNQGPINLSQIQPMMRYGYTLAPREVK